jgi:hypothetical protein
MNNKPFDFIPAFKPGYAFEGMTFVENISIGFSLFRDTGSARFIAVGWHEKSRVINTMRKLSRNLLTEWEECPLVLYENWFESSGDRHDPPCCYCTLSRDPHQGRGVVFTKPFKATIIRHQAWNIGSKKAQDCARFKGWYLGSRARPLPHLPALVVEDKSSSLPGFALWGKLGERRDRLLEWPTADYDLVKKQGKAWKIKGATHMHLVADGYCFYLEGDWIDSKIEARFKRAIASIGEDFCVGTALGI